ncbi:LacI family transcriptional regulator [Isoptericola sp. 4D.3]|uniref:LacI family transcriptional regulator n=1 Tax=Isoptericola peretonis TaxID=2918523 RepID=A0ABT0J8C6_9MICO|nr:LacI family transcriptional regulator [Isoptericola sp. 4D.3]
MTTPSRTGAVPAVGPRRTTITDVARAAGVSIAVVSYALNGRPGVSDRTRRHVLRTAADLGWRPSAAARSLRSAPSSVSVQAVGTATAGRAAAVALGIRSVLHDDEIAPATDVVVDVAPDHDAAARALEHAWTERRHAVFVVPGPARDDPRVRLAARHGVPLVTLAHPRPDDPPTQTTGADAGSGSTSAWFSGDAEGRTAGYLRELGHSRVAVLARDGLEDPARALLDALAGGGSTDGRVVVDEVDYRTPEDASAGAARLLATEHRPTAVVADGDVALLAVLEAARQRDLAVPWDLSVLVLEDSPACRLVHPPVTAVARPWADLGVAAAELVRPHLLGAGRPAEHPHEDPPDQAPRAAARLVIRGSTAPAPA